MNKKSRRILIVSLALAAMCIIAMMVFSGCNNDDDVNGISNGNTTEPVTETSYKLDSTEALTDINGEQITDAQGNVVTAAVYEYAEIVTDSDGKAILNEDGTPVTTIKYIHEYAEPVIDEEGHTVYDNSGAVLTTKIAVDEEGSTVKPVSERTTASTTKATATTRTGSNGVGEDIGDVVSNTSTPSPANLTESGTTAANNSTKPGSVSTTKANLTTKPVTATATKPGIVTTTKKPNTTTKPATTVFSYQYLDAEQQEAIEDANKNEQQGNEVIRSEIEEAPASLFSYTYDGAGKFFYTEDDPWQRNFGFNTLYDWSAALVVMYYDTVRATFNYNNLDYMIQMWKGQYGYIFIGSEIGVYYKQPGVDTNHYECADDDHLIPMEMTLYKQDEDNGKMVKLFTRKYEPQWWSTGFVVGHLNDMNFNDRTCLAVEARMTFDTEQMASLFAKALEGKGFKRSDSTPGFDSSDAFSISGRDVYFAWRYANDKT